MVGISTRAALVFLAANILPQGGFAASVGYSAETPGLSADSDYLASVNRVEVRNRLSEVFVPNLVATRRQIAGTEIALDLRAGAPGLGSGNGGRDIFVINSRAAIVAPLPAATWVFLPMVAGLMVFVQRSARKAV